MEQMRLVSSGTEAVMSAISVARAFTKRDGILKFEGCYHGHSDYLLAKAGSGLATLGIPDSPGVPADFTQHTLTAPYNDIDRRPANHSRTHRNSSGLRHCRANRRQYGRRGAGTGVFVLATSLTS